MNPLKKPSLTKQTIGPDSKTIANNATPIGKLEQSYLEKINDGQVTIDYSRGIYYHADPNFRGLTIPVKFQNDQTQYWVAVREDGEQFQVNNSPGSTTETYNLVGGNMKATEFMNVKLIQNENLKNLINDKIVALRREEQRRIAGRSSSTSTAI